MDIRVLEYFLAVAREKSISAAARSLHISQPALSTQLKALEKEVGSALFIRGAKGSKRVVLTEEGLLLRKRAEEIVELVRKTQRELSSEGRNIAGEVFIGTGESDTVRIFAKAAKKVRKDYPDITVHIRSGNAAFVTEQLEKGLKMIACTRLLLKDVNIASTTALQALADDGRERGLLAGANVIMPNVTDLSYRRRYQLYADKPNLDENSEESRDDLIRRIHSIGEEILWDQHGDSRHYFNRKEKDLKS